MRFHTLEILNIKILRKFIIENIINLLSYQINRQMSSIKVFQKFQPNTKRGVYKNCEICKKQFGFMNRDEHQCKRCFRSICSDCGKTKRDVYKIGFIKTPHRLCVICTKESDFIQELVNSNSLVFGEDSPIAKKWLQKTPQEQSHEFIKSSSHRQLQRFSFEIFKEMWDSYNFSLRELIGLLTFEKDQKEIYNLVKQAYEQILDKGHDEKLQTILYHIVFLLCFTNPSSCARIFDYLINLRQTVKDGKLMLEAFLKSLKIQQSQIKKLNDYINYKLKLFMNSNSINTLTVQCSIHLFTRIFQKNKVEELYMLFAIVLEANIQNLLNNKDSKMDCDLLIVRNCELQKYIEKYRLISSVKTQQFIIKKSVQNQKKLQQSVLIKTVSNNESETMSLQMDTTAWRKTKKQSTWSSNEKFQEYRIQTLKSNNIKKNSYQQDQSCYNCQINKKKVEELSKNLRERDQQIENLNFKLTFSRKNTSPDSFKNNNIQDQDSIKKKDQQLIKIQRENLLLKQKIQQLQKSNKFLVNVSSTQQMQGSFQINKSEPEEHQKVIQMLKKTLETKNKQLEQNVKKNKLLNYQIQQMQKQYSIKKPDSKEGTREELLKKIEELSLKINQEHDQKIKLSTEVFELRQTIKSFDGQTSTKDGSQKSKASQCSTF